MAELTMAASGVRALLEMAVAMGADRRALLDRSGIEPADLENGDNRIPFPKYVALMKAGQDLCNDPALALHFGETVDPAEISFTNSIGAQSMTEAFAIGNRYARLTVEVGDENTDRFVLTRTGGQLWMIDNRRNANEFPELTESGFARMACSVRRLLGGKQLIKEVHVTHAAPAYRAEYDRVFGVPVVFGSDRNALLLDDAAMNIKTPVSATSVSEVLTAHADDLLEKLGSSKSVKHHVERLLMESLTGGDVSMDAIASKLGLSRQTLFRRLKAENTTFEKVLDQVRYRLALHHLDEGKKSVNQTAYLVGFSDPAAFSRAFKRWTGRSPRGYLNSSRET
jgi:AraC-type DNA-binding domain-containing proteins